MAKSKLDALNELSGSIENLQSTAAKKLEDARMVSSANRLQRANVARAGTGLSTGQVAQKTAQASAQEQGQVAQQNIATGVQLGMQEGQQKLKQQEIHYKKTLTDMQSEYTQQASDRVNALSRLGSNVRQQLFDAQLEFKQDESKRTVFNERQLRDAAILMARDKAEILDNFQTMQQQSSDKIAVLEVANNKLLAITQRGWLQKQDDLDFATKKKIKEIQYEIAKQIAKDKKKAQGRAAFVQGATSAAIASGNIYAIGGAVVLNVAYQSGALDNV